MPDVLPDVKGAGSLPVESTPVVLIDPLTGEPYAAAAGGSAATVADGADVAQGASYDVPYADATGAAGGTLVGLLKGIFVRLAGQLGVFATSSGNLAPVALGAVNAALAGQVCKRVCLVATKDAFVTQGGNDFLLTAQAPQWLEGVGNTNTLQVRHTGTAGTLYVHWEA